MTNETSDERPTTLGALIRRQSPEAWERAMDTMKESILRDLALMQSLGDYADRAECERLAQSARGMADPIREGRVRHVTPEEAGPLADQLEAEASRLEKIADRPC